MQRTHPFTTLSSPRISSRFSSLLFFPALLLFPSPLLFASPSPFFFFNHPRCLAFLSVPDSLSLDRSSVYLQPPSRPTLSRMAQWRSYYIKIELHRHCRPTAFIFLLLSFSFSRARSLCCSFPSLVSSPDYTPYYIPHCFPPRATPERQSSR